jgi:lysophospholipase L1-like esterase
MPMEMKRKSVLLVGLGMSLIAATKAVPKRKLYVVGDSTACIYASSLSPRTGWGQILQDYFKADSVEVIDKALSGRSSKSFYAEKSWDPIKAVLQKGDYVIIAFGHNDEKTEDAERGTLPGSTFEQYLSIYIDDAKAKGAIPLLVTPIERNGWSTAVTVKESHGAYPKAIRDLAAAKGIDLVDLTALSKALYEKLGKDTTTNKLFLNLPAGAYPNYPDGSVDNTHLQLRGAREIAKALAENMVKQKLATLSTWVVGTGSVALTDAPRKRVSFGAETESRSVVDIQGRSYTSHRGHRQAAYAIRKKN